MAKTPSRPRPKAFRLPTKAEEKRNRVMWTIAALGYTMVADEPDGDRDYVEYSERVTGIVETGTLLSALLETHGANGNDSCDPYITIDNVCEFMVKKFKRELTYAMTEAEIFSCIDWNDPTP